MDKAAAGAQPEGITRRIFFDPPLSFDTTTLEPRSSTGAEALASSHKKWSVQLSYCPTMTEMDRRHKRWRGIFYRSTPVRRRIASAARIAANCRLESHGSEHEFRQR
jgi:hypothetical protein